MNVLLVDSDADLRSEVTACLEAMGCRVFAFGDGQFAFLYLLARPHEIDAVALNSDVGDGLLRRLEALVPISAVTYTAGGLPGSAELAAALLPSIGDGSQQVV
jgi:DNA-binding response OmpR family regulator